MPSEVAQLVNGPLLLLFMICIFSFMIRYSFKYLNCSEESISGETPYSKEAQMAKNKGVISIIEAISKPPALKKKTSPPPLGNKRGGDDLVVDASKK